MKNVEEEENAVKRAMSMTHPVKYVITHDSTFIEICSFFVCTDLTTLQNSS